MRTSAALLSSPEDRSSIETLVDDVSTAIEAARGEFAAADPALSTVGDALADLAAALVALGAADCADLSGVIAE